MVSPRVGLLNPKMTKSDRLYGAPWWCAPSVMNSMGVVVTAEKCLVLSRAKAKLTIMPARITTPGVEGWSISWVVHHRSLGGIDVSAGSRLFSDEDLRHAFLFVHVQDEGMGIMTDTDRALLKKFRGDFAREGKFIVWRSFLNIPGPRVCRNGDPSISIRLTEEVKRAVFQLLTV